MLSVMSLLTPQKQFGVVKSPKGHPRWCNRDKVIPRARRCVGIWPHTRAIFYMLNHESLFNKPVHNRAQRVTILANAVDGLLWHGVRMENPLIIFTHEFGFIHIMML